MGIRLIFTSYGFNNKVARKLLTKELAKDTDLGNKKFFVFQEPYVLLEDLIRNALISIGFQEENIYFSSQRGSEKVLCEDALSYVYVGEGNTFEIMHLLRSKGLVELIREACNRGVNYIGCSAGAMMAGADIEVALEFDKNLVCLEDMTGLRLIPDSIIIPHYTKSECKRFVERTPGIENRYRKIYSVDNKGILVI